jgi:hypothetical protein
MSEVKLRLAIRDLYRGDGGPLNDYNQGWNDGTDAAAEILYPLVERAEGGDMSEAEKMAQRLEGICEPSTYDSQVADLAAALIREQDAKIKRMAAALKEYHEAYEAGGWAVEDINERHADALRDAGVKT